MPVALTAAAINLVVALSCGAVIGSERQVRQRMAGLRTNALVALGAAGFVTFSQLQALPDTSPSRVAAQVVSGIGFLGAGIIFRDGLEIHGINTAATLWCSAAVGLIAATGQVHFALLMTGLVVFVNLGLRPLVKLLKKYTSAGDRVSRSYRVQLTCRAADEGAMRGLILRTLTIGGMRLSEITGQSVDGAVDLVATFTGEGMAEPLLEQAMQRMAVEPGLLRFSWLPVDEI